MTGVSIRRGRQAHYDFKQIDFFLKSNIINNIITVCGMIHQRYFVMESYFISRSLHVSLTSKRVNVPAFISICLCFHCCHFSSLFPFFHPFLYPQKVALAQFPELSPSERDLGIFRNQQAVSCSAKSSAEIQPFTTDRHPGETHRHRQTRLELVRQHILICTYSYIVTHFLNNPWLWYLKACSPPQKMRLILYCAHIDALDTFSDS